MSTAEAIDVPSTSVVPVTTSSLVGLSAPVSDIVRAQASYHEVCVALLDENDVQVIGRKQFKKRSAWNKLAVAFGVSTSEVRTVHERDERGRITRTECVVRAQAPNGRISDGIGACDLYERCCDPATCSKSEVWEDSGRPTGHVHCVAFPCKQAHFSNPQHDIPATAFTRASNRAKADLFGMGEVSAEEISDGWQPADSPTLIQQFEQINGEQIPIAPDAPITRSGPGASAQAKNTESMRKRIFAVSNKLGMTMAGAVTEALGEDVAEENLTFAQCRKVNDWLTEEEKRQA